MSNSSSITDQRHNDYVGSDANIGRIPGANKATTGHHFVSVFPKEGAPNQSTEERRPQEHLPPPTGRDLPPNAGHRVPSGGQQTNFAPNTYMPGNNIAPNEDPYHQTDRPPQPLEPAPGSNTVIDRDPWASKPSAADTLQGATSQDVHGGIGQPFGGQTSAELHHDGKQHRKRNLQGVDQYGNADEV